MFEATEIQSIYLSQSNLLTSLELINKKPNQAISIPPKIFLETDNITKEDLPFSVFEDIANLLNLMVEDGTFLYSLKFTPRSHQIVKTSLFLPEYSPYLLNEKTTLQKNNSYDILINKDMSLEDKQLLLNSFFVLKNHTTIFLNDILNCPNQKISNHILDMLLEDKLAFPIYTHYSRSSKQQLSSFKKILNYNIEDFKVSDFIDDIKDINFWHSENIHFIESNNDNQYPFSTKLLQLYEKFLEHNLFQELPPYTINDFIGFTHNDIVSPFYISFIKKLVSTLPDAVFSSLNTPLKSTNLMNEVQLNAKELLFISEAKKRKIISNDEHQSLEDYSKISTLDFFTELQECLPFHNNFRNTPCLLSTGNNHIQGDNFKISFKSTYIFIEKNENCEFSNKEIYDCFFSKYLTKIEMGQTLKHYTPDAINEFYNIDDQLRTISLRKQLSQDKKTTDKTNQSISVKKI